MSWLQKTIARINGQHAPQKPTEATSVSFRVPVLNGVGSNENATLPAASVHSFAVAPLPSPRADSSPLRICATCATTRPVMLLMAPGFDGCAWYLCGPCWRA